MADVTTRIACDGYTQLELNQVAFRRDGRIEAQSKLKAYVASTAEDGFDKNHPAENGMLLVFNAAKREISKPTAATDKVLLNYTTEHMYDERTPGLKNFCLVPGTFLPRLGYLATGDKYTTNCVSYAKGDTYTDEDAFWAAVATCGTTPLYACPCTDGSHYVSTSATNAVAQVVKADTMPDGQKAIQFIAL
jgi:hypothetical protein